MSAKKRTTKALALLIPAGVLGISSALASTPAHAETTLASVGSSPLSVAGRLSEIRSAVSAVNTSALKSPVNGAKLMLADWLNIGGGGGGVGWRNGGWGNGGWGNGGWGNGGWHNWGNGGWHNWGNGGWHNFWHNW